MSTLSDSTPRRELVAEWWDSDIPSQRSRSLALWKAIRQAGDVGTLYSSTRATSSDVWDPPETIGVEITLAAADRVAETLGLARYLPRPAAVPAEAERGSDADHCELCGSQGLLSYADDADRRTLLVCDVCRRRVSANV